LVWQWLLLFARNEELSNPISNISRLSYNYLALSGAEFVSKALTAVAFAFMARIFGPELYGQLEFSIAILFLFSLFVDSGLGSYGAREIAKNRENFGQLFVTVFSLRFFLATIAVLIMNFFALHPSIEYPTRILVFYYSLTLFGLPFLTQWVFQGHDQMVPVAISSLIRWSIFFGGVLFFIKDGTMIWAVPVIEGIAILFAGAFLNSLLLRRFRNFIFDWKIHPKQFVLVWKRAIPIGASEIVWAIRVFFATLILGLFIGGIQLGWFTSAHRIVIALHAFVWLYFYNIFPSLARASQSPLNYIQNLIKVSMRITTWIGVYFTIIASIFALIIIQFIYGREFAQSAGIFGLMIWIIPLSLISGHYRFLLIGYGHQVLEFISSVIGAIVNVFIIFLLVPVLGGIGASWSLIISEIVIWITAYYFVRRKIGYISFTTEIWRPILGGIIMFIIISVLPVSAWIGIFTATIIYGVFFFVSNPKVVSQIRTFTSRNAVI